MFIDETVVVVTMAPGSRDSRKNYPSTFQWVRDFVIDGFVLPNTSLNENTKPFDSLDLLCKSAFGFYPNRHSGDVKNPPDFVSSITETKTCVPKRSPRWPLPKNDKSIVMNDYQANITKKETAPVILWCNEVVRSDVDHKLVGYKVRLEQFFFLGNPDVKAFVIHEIPIVGYIRKVQRDAGAATVLKQQFYSGKVNPDDVSSEMNRLVGLTSVKVLSASRESIHNTAAAIAEGRETLGYVAQRLKDGNGMLDKMWKKYGPNAEPPKGIKRKLDRVAKRNKWVRRGKAVSKLPDKLGSWWMEYRYAITPMMGDIKDAVKAATIDLPEFVTTRGGEQIELTDAGDGTAVLQWKRRTFSVITNSDVTAFLKCNGVIKQRFDFNNATDLARRSSMWVPDGAWEVIPFSFVADWFLNVGDYIASLRPSLSMSENSCMSKKVHMESRSKFETFSENTTASIPFRIKYRVSHETDGIVNRYWVGDSKREDSIKMQQIGTSWNSSTSIDRVVAPFSRSFGVEVNPMNWKRTVDAVVLTAPYAKRLGRKAKNNVVRVWWKATAPVDYETYTE